MKLASVKLVQLARLPFNVSRLETLLPQQISIITAEPGDNVILTCRAAENKAVIVVEWSRTDLEPDQYVLVYRDSQFFPEGQSPSFRNRVSLLDVKNGDVSLVLKNVTTDDTGTYECRVVQRGNNQCTALTAVSKKFPFLLLLLFKSTFSDRLRREHYTFKLPYVACLQS
uniref:Ig-like domain-containing protein n=1 Tax=Fundulus heteroclitus TaxID=8078 RepID=A0A3Q2PWN5_FUNHE